MNADNENHEHPEELIAYERTEWTLTDGALCRLLGRAVIGAGDSPVCADEGAWCVEHDRQGWLARWRYYRDRYSANAS